MVIALLVALTGCAKTPEAAPPATIEATTPTPVAITATVTTTSTPVINSWKVVSVDYKITDKSDNYWYYSWKLVMQNDGDLPFNFGAEVKLLDSDGFMIEYDVLSTTSINPHSQQSFTGETMAKLPSGSTITKADVVIYPQK